MNLSQEIGRDLWIAISKPYGAGHFSHAIVDATHYLSAAIRDKSGLDGDGAALIGQALGGDSPRLRINKLETESDRNAQRGIEQMLRGLYLGIRNPRSHNQAQDSQETADAVIVFINYLLTVLEAAREAFTADTFVARVTDSEFVDSDLYADLLVAEIPVLKRGEALIALYRRRDELDLPARSNLILKLIDGLSEAQASAYLAVVSDELRVATENAPIRSSLQMLTPALWPGLDQVARIRIETKLIKGIDAGKSHAEGRVEQSLATWSRDFLRVFTLRADAETSLVGKLAFGETADHHYVARFFLHSLPEIVLREANIGLCVSEIAGVIKKGDGVMRRHLIGAIRDFPNSWQMQLADALAGETDPMNPAVKLRSGAPFLSSPEKDDDIPF